MPVLATRDVEGARGGPTRSSSDDLILLVNDEPDHLELMRAVLRNAGYRIEVALSAEEALRAARRSRPRLIISDVAMPGTDGIELCRRLRADEALNAAPVILVSAYRKDSASALEGLRAGAEDYVELPYDPVRLVAKVARLLERRAGEDALRESESKYRMLMEQASDGICITDGRTVLDVNTRGCEMLGYEREKLIGLGIHELNDPEDLGNEPLRLEEIRAGKTLVSERVLRRRDGSLLQVEVSAKALEDGRIQAIVRDITERKRAEEALRATRQSYSDLVENAKDIIYTHDLEGRYLSLNKAGQEITGYTREEVTGMSLAQVVTPEHLEKAREMVAKKLAGEGPTVYEVEFIAKDGRRVAVEVSTMLLYRDGRPVAVQGIARDVTERRRLEEQLRQAQKMEAVGRLAGGVAHDFNNLLTIIGGYTSLMLRRMSPFDPLRERAEGVKEAADRAADLTRQLLAFSRKQILQPRVLDLNSLIQGTGKMLRALISEDYEIVTLLQDGLGRISADPVQVEQILMNLLVNARDAMPGGGRIVIETADIALGGDYVSTHISAAAGPYVMLAVTDSGMGMDAETQKHIFEPFFTTKDAGQGTGLGLATVYGIVRQSGGSIWVYSEPGAGTTFKIYLPRVDEEVEDGGHDETNTGCARGTETVLLVEDDPAVAAFARDVLEECGYHVIASADPEDALRLCEGHDGTIHLLLTDVVMPRMNGRQLAAAAAERRTGIRVLYMSGYTDDAVLRRGLLDPELPFIQKPFTPDALELKVREVLDS